MALSSADCFIAMRLLSSARRRGILGVSREQRGVRVVRIGLRVDRVLLTDGPRVRADVPDVVFFGVHAEHQVALSNAGVRLQHAITDLVVGARSEHVADGRVRAADRKRTGAGLPRRERGATLLMPVRALTSSEFSVTAIEPVEQQQILAIRLERRQKLVEGERRLASVDEATAGLIAVRLEHEDDADGARWPEHPALAAESSLPGAATRCPRRPRHATRSVG